jgi:secreted trypsin-like serine protease
VRWLFRQWYYLSHSRFTFFPALEHGIATLFFSILGTSVCSGDSGGGLVFKFDGRYYVTGIVSLSPQASTGGCDTQQYGLYTKVGTYISDFIIKTESQFRP